MNTTRNNKGFSLVELIVVIAIMAVLMGILAPTLIGNIEKSRESKDLSNISSMRQAVVAAIAVEEIYFAAIPPNSADVRTYNITATGLDGASANFNSAFNASVRGDTAMTSASGLSGTLQVKIKGDGAVECGVYDASGNAVTASRNNVPMVAK